MGNVFVLILCIFINFNCIVIFMLKIIKINVKMNI